MYRLVPQERTVKIVTAFLRPKDDVFDSSIHARTKACHMFPVKSPKYQTRS